jgi:hypothetical protein
MPVPTIQPVGAKYYVVYAASLAVAASPGIVMGGRGRVIDIMFTPLVSPTTTATVITPAVNGTQMQQAGANATFSIAAAAVINTNAVDFVPTGLNTFDKGDVITLTSNAGAANAASVPGYYTIVVRE